MHYDYDYDNDKKQDTKSVLQTLLCAIFLLQPTHLHITFHITYVKFL
jgi:hypothetical protein